MQCPFFADSNPKRTFTPQCGIMPHEKTNSLPAFVAAAWRARPEDGQQGPRLSSGWVLFGCPAATVRSHVHCQQEP